MKTIILITLIFGLTGTGKAADNDSFYQAYAQVFSDKEIHMQLKFRLYSSRSTEALDQMIYRLDKIGEDVHIAIGQSEVFYLNPYLVRIDHQDQSVNVSQQNLPYFPGLQAMSESEMKQSLRVIDSKESDGITRYQVEVLTDPSFKSGEFWFDSEGQLLKIRLAIREGSPYQTAYGAEYCQIDYQPLSDGQYRKLSLQHFFTGKQAPFALQADYENYKLSQFTEPQK